MATIADVLKRASDALATSTVMVFQTYPGPWCRTDAITSRDRISVTTNSTTAAFSQTLREGTYRVSWRIGAEFSSVVIAVPSGTGTYDFNAVVVVDDDTALRNVFDDWADIQTETVPVASYVVILRETEDGARDILFIRSTHANVLAYTPDGTNVVADEINQRFLRQGVAPEDLA